MSRFGCCLLCVACCLLFVVKCAVFGDSCRTWSAVVAGCSVVAVRRMVCVVLCVCCFLSVDRCRCSLRVDCRVLLAVCCVLLDCC